MGPLLDTIRTPGEPRHASQPLTGLAAEDIAYVASLGYPIHTTREDQ